MITKSANDSIVRPRHIEDSLEVRHRNLRKPFVAPVHKIAGHRDKVGMKASCFGQRTLYQMLA